MRIGLCNLGLSFGIAALFSMSTATGADSQATAQIVSEFAAKSVKGIETSPTDRPVAERTAPHSATAASSAVETSLLFRRVQVPEAQIKDWPRSNLRFLPIDAAEFERLIEESRRTTDARKRIGGRRKAVGKN